MTISGDLSRMGEALLEEAREEAAKIIERAEKDAAAVMEKAEQETREIVEKAVAQEEVQGSREAKRRVAAADLEAARLILGAREEMIGQSFSRLDEMLRKIPNGLDYSTVLENLVSEAATGLGQADISVQVRLADRYIMNDDWCRNVGGKLKITIRVAREPAQIDGGVIVAAQNGRLRFAQSFEALVMRHEETLRSIIAQHLWETSWPIPSSDAGRNK